LRRALVGLVALVALVAQLAPAGAQTFELEAAPPVYVPPTPARAGAGDATVIAVIDNAFTPYHWDYLASKMPQAQDGKRSNDLPLGTAPDKWLPGFPNPSAFASYRSLDLSLEEKNPLAPIEPLDEKDAAQWEKVKPSTADEQHLYWIPDTKVIGALDFGGNKLHGSSNSHGTGTSSVSVGNIHGTCPECLLVFLSYSGQASGEAAINWAMNQPWIDAISNSYGFSITPVTRDRLYSGSNTKLQRKASERGQTIFFSAGNGLENAFLVPNQTLMSSQEGPDWNVTVGAVSPGAHASYTGHGKPADIAGIGSSYPAAYGATTVGGTGSGGFGGTSNATPQIAGTYARALYLTRAAMKGTSRRQEAGVIARGDGVGCAAARSDCELRDGKLTADELRNRLFRGAVHTDPGMTPGGVGSLPVLADEEYMNEGHGSYFGREKGPLAGTKEWLNEFERLVGPLFGRSKELKRPKGEKEWMTVASYCRQHLWGNWTGGYFDKGKTQLPENDPQKWPFRSAIQTGCPHLQPLP
jgi:hypothetical protein